jgi:uncharacterized protein (TIGR02271 family)
MLLQPGTFQVKHGVLELQESTTAFQTVQLSSDNSIEARTLDDHEQLVVPVIQEEVHVERQIVERGGVRVHKRVSEHEEVVEQPTFREEVSVERIPIGRPIDAEIGSRQEGDTLIVPVLEEMLVVEKRLVLKEEVRITKRRVAETEQARIMLRTEHVDIENLEPVAVPDATTPQSAGQESGGSRTMA